jgi:hypothetical protein
MSYKTLSSKPTALQLIEPAVLAQRKSSDYNYQKYVGWAHSAIQQSGYNAYFSEDNIKAIQDTIHTILKQQGYNVIPSKDVVEDVMSTVLNYNTPVIGDIYTVFTIPDNGSRDDVANMNQRVINIIASNIINEYDTIRNNEQLSAWVNVKGSFNKWGLRSHSVIRKREKDYTKGFFNMNY